MERTLWLALALLLGGTLAVDAGDRPPAPPKIDDSRFEFLAGLEGTWVGRSESGGMPDGTFEFRVTSGGTAIEEREMIGTPMEMMTVYHMDGDALVATHYCMLGNQPHLRAAGRVVDGTLAFSCDGHPGNTTSHDEHHVHAWSITRQDDGSLLYSAELMENGHITEKPTTVLVRRTKTASR
jgi:hypothetical protein